MCGYNVCNDLMVEIFERLPSESIIRFRSLSKYWHSRLASPEFIRHYRLRSSKTPPKLLIRHLAYDSVYTLHTRDQMRSGYLTIPGVKLPWEHKRTEVVGSCNGILCLRDNYNFILWNLSIRRKLDVPPPHPRLKAEFAVGFGFDPITDDYKIVAMSCDKSEPASDRDKTFIYSLKTESWSAIPSPSSRFLNEKRSSEKAWFSNGILHWVLHGYLTLATTEDLSLFTLTFNLSSHVFGHIVFPEPRNITQLTNINGCLAAVSWEIDGVWIRAMKEHDKTESWSLLYEDERRLFRSVKVLQPITNGDVVAHYEDGDLLALYGPNVWDSYVCGKPRTRLRTKLWECQPHSNCFRHEIHSKCFNHEIHTYVESLELLDNESAKTCGKTAEAKKNTLW